MGRIEKDKNIYKFYVDGKATPYTLDVNTATWYGLRGSAIKSKPTCITMNMLYASPYSVVKLLRNNFATSAALLSLADRLDALNIDLVASEIVALSALQGLDLADFAKWYNTNNGGHYVRDYVESKQTLNFIKKYNLQGCGLEETYIENVAKVATMVKRDTHEEITEHEVKVMCYWLGRGVYEYHEGWYDMRSRLFDAIYWGRKTGLGVEKSDFFRQYINLRRAYKALEGAKLNSGIAEMQNAHREALTFENEHFFTIIPTTVEELVAEGDSQGNCVGGYGKSIANGNRCVVFVREKSNPKKSYITCDILYGYSQYHNGQINQYLARHNGSVHNELALQFQKEFQEHLFAIEGR